MKRLVFVFSILGMTSAFGAPQCNIDAVPAANGLVGVVSGSATGFLPKEPVYVTVTNNGAKFTTQTDRDGKFAVVYAETSNHTEVLCWQGYVADQQLEAVGK